MILVPVASCLIDSLAAWIAFEGMVLLNFPSGSGGFLSVLSSSNGFIEIFKKRHQQYKLIITTTEHLQFTHEVIKIAPIEYITGKKNIGR